MVPSGLVCDGDKNTEFLESLVVGMIEVGLPAFPLNRREPIDPTFTSLDTYLALITIPAVTTAAKLNIAMIAKTNLVFGERLDGLFGFKGNLLAVCSLVAAESCDTGFICQPQLTQ